MHKHADVMLQATSWPDTHRCRKLCGSMLRCFLQLAPSATLVRRCASIKVMLPAASWPNAQVSRHCNGMYQYFWITAPSAALDRRCTSIMKSCRQLAAGQNTRRCKKLQNGMLLLSDSTQCNSDKSCTGMMR